MALLLSGTFPGLGQLYNRQPGKGVAFLAAGIVLTWWLLREVPTDPLAITRQGAARLGLGVTALLAVWLWSIVDGWRVAGR
jgi:hypothetical protein